MNKHTLTLSALCLSALLWMSCTNNETPKASPETINNSATATAPVQPNTADTATGAVISFEKTRHDFGNINEGEKVEYAFKFKNTGKQDLLIASAVASCGCTVPTYSKEPIPPQGEGFIKVVFDSKYRAEHFEKQVMVTSNTTPTETILYISGYVIQKPQNALPNQVPH